jgi:ribosome-associated translation inhibitor RaiA
MQLEASSDGVPLDGSLNQYVHDRLKTSFRGVEKKIRNVTMRVGAQATEYDSTKHYCTLIVRLYRGGFVTGADVGAELHATIDRVVDEVGHAVASQVKSRWW